MPPRVGDRHGSHQQVSVTSSTFPADGTSHGLAGGAIAAPAEVLGGWSPLAIKHLGKMASMSAARSASGDSRAASVYLFQQLAVVLQRGNATLILSRYIDK